jgi:hypothetical protein
MQNQNLQILISRKPHPRALLEMQNQNLQILISRKPHPRALLEMQNQNLHKKEYPTCIEGFAKTTLF